VVSARWASGGGGYLAGLLTRTAASPKIQVINGAMAGAQVVQFLGAVDPAAAGTAYRPRNALGKFIATGKKGVAMLGGFYNDRGASVTLQAVLDALTAICLQLQAANWDIWYIGYPSLDGSGLTQAQFDAWEQPIIALLRDTFNAVIFQESQIFTNYATYNALGYYGDTLHVSNLATTKIADSLMSAIALSNSGALPA
jgi:hypothetical protein